MNPDQVVHYKIFLCAAGYEPEIRRITIDKDICQNYFYLKQKILSIFPTLKDIAFTISWKDREGDNIRICTDDELVIALKEMEYFDFKKIYVSATPQGKEGPLHPDVFCDGCDHPVQGFRYKCLVCFDYDLCPDCERSQIHPDHPMIRIPLPLSPEMPFGRRFSRDVSRMAKHMERLFQQTAEHADKKAKGDYCAGNKSETQKQQKPKYCPRNNVHNLIHGLVMNHLEKMRGVASASSSSAANNEQPREGNQPEPQRSSAPDGCPILEEQKKFVNILTNGINSFLDPLGDYDFVAHENPVKEEGAPKRTEPHQSASVKMEGRTSTQASAQAVPVTRVVIPMETAPVQPEVGIAAPMSVGTSVPATLIAPIAATAAPNQAPVSRIPTQNVGVTALASTVGIPALAPTLGVPALVPTVALPAPITNVGTTRPVSDNDVALTPSVKDPEPVMPVPSTPMSPNGYVDLSDGFYPSATSVSDIDNSWTIINKGMADSMLSQQSAPPPPVSFLPENASAQPVGNSSIIPDTTDLKLSSTQSGVNSSIEELMSRLVKLGFKDEEWLRQLVQSLGGNLEEVLKFLLPVPKPTTNLNN